MPITVSSGSEHVVVYPDRSRASSGGSASVRSGPSRSYSGGSSSSWVDTGYDDGIGPSDSASRSRQSSVKPYTSRSRPEPLRRRSPPRPEEREEIPSRAPSSRRLSTSRHRRSETRRVPSDESASTVAYPDDYPYSHHGMQPPRVYPVTGYRHVHPPSHGGYPPSNVTSLGPGYAPEGFAPPQQALMHMPHQTDGFGYPAPNPFNPAGAQPNPFSPMGSTAASGYFTAEHAAPMAHHQRPPGPARPHSIMGPPSHYGSEMASMYGQPSVPSYGGYAMPHMMYPPMAGMSGWYPPTVPQASPPPSDAKDDKNNAEFEKIKALMKMREDALDAREKEIIVQREAEVLKKAKEEAERVQKEQVAAAEKKGKEAAEKKAEDAAKAAKEEHEKKLKEVEAKKEEAEKKQKALEEEAKKNKPAESPIKFTDAMGRKYSFPFQLCKTWKGMESLIKQAFVNVEVLGEHVLANHYELKLQDGEIILPQVWDSVIKPDWEVTMHMWPGIMEVEDGKRKDKHHHPDVLSGQFANMGIGDIFEDPKRFKKSTTKKKGKHDSQIIDVGPLPTLPPGGLPGFGPMDLNGGDFGLGPLFPPDIERRDRPKGRTKSKSSKDIPTLASWFAGTSGSRPSKKR